MQKTAKSIHLSTKDLGPVLVVEDHASCALVTATMLELLGYSHDIVLSGEKALQAVKTRTYVAILMDIVLPGIDGIEAAVAIRAFERQENRDSTPIIAMTVEPSAEGKNACFEAGISDYLSKPFQQEELQRILAHCSLPDVKTQKFIA